MVHITFVYKFMIYFIQNLTHMPSTNGSLFIAIDGIAKYIIRLDTELL